MLSNSASIQPLLAQFRARYPMGSLISEFLTVHDGQYAVRALVQMGGMTLATGLATATDIETAEDRAKARALEALGIQMISPLLGNPALPSSPAAGGAELLGSSLSDASALKPSSVSAMANSPASLPIDSPINPSMNPINPPMNSPINAPINATGERSPRPPSPSWDERPTDAAMPSPPAPAKSPSPAPKAAIADLYAHVALDAYDSDTPDLPDLTESSSGAEELGIEPEGDRPVSAAPAKSKPRKSEAPPPSSLSSPPSDSAPASGDATAERSVDLSEVLAQIDVQMMRLGWTKRQGRDHLKQTYGKSTRSELDVDELFDFLHHLEQQP
ncbi:MAG TPA: hypothetical protein V6C88_12480 [Chroococcidiopsis sp.]